MAFLSSRIDAYKVVRYGMSSDGVIAGYIHCYFEGTNVVSCAFHWDEARVPANELESFGRVKLHYPASAFAGVLDVLRNEDPIYFGFIDTSRVGYISTNDEPTGEEES